MYGYIYVCVCICIYMFVCICMASQDEAVVKNPPASAEDAGISGLIPGSRRPPEIGNDNPLQYSCLKIPTDMEAWRGTAWGWRRVGQDRVAKHRLAWLLQAPTAGQLQGQGLKLRSDLQTQALSHGFLSLFWSFSEDDWGEVPFLNFRVLALYVPSVTIDKIVGLRPGRTCPRSSLALSSGRLCHHALQEVTECGLKVSKFTEGK